MPLKIDLTGRRFERLVVLKEADKRGPQNQIYWLCLCDCGKQVEVNGGSLRSGSTKSCGCYKIEKFINMAKTYPRKKDGKAKTRLYKIWRGMIRRTMNPKRQNYYRYGGRGIRVCDEWLHDFSAFKEWSMKNGYNDTLSIDRIDSNGNYCPENCRWADKIQQARNRETTRYFEYNGENKTVVEWAEITGIPYTTILRRINDGRTKNIFTKGRCTE